MAWIYLVASEESPWPWQNGCGLLPTVKETDMPCPHYSPECQTEDCPSLRYGMTCEHSTQVIFHQLISSTEDSHVRTSALRVVESAWEESEAELFFHIARLVEEINPRFVFLENVPAIRTRGLNSVAQTFTALGYDCRWEVIPAYTDQRFFLGERWFCLAKAKSERRKKGRQNQRPAQAKPLYHESILEKIWNPNADSMAREDHGLRIWSHCTHGLGNAVVPKQAKEAFMRLAGIKPTAQSEGV